MDADLDTLATALYVRVDDLLTCHPERAPARPKIGIAPKISDAEMITLAVLAALLSHTSEARWLRYARAHLAPMFPYLPQQPGYNKRLRALAPTLSWLIGVLARDTSVWTDDVWVVDSTPVECGRSKETVRRSDLAGWAEYGYCASHSRFFWGLRLHLLCTLQGLPVSFALTGAKADERTVMLDMLHADPTLTARGTQILIGDKNYYGRSFEHALPEAGIDLLRPARKGETERTGARFFKPLRQTIESINDTPQRPTRPRTPRRTHQSRRHHPSLPTAARPHRRHLAQRPHRPTHPALTDRLRPLTLGIGHLVVCLRYTEGAPAAPERRPAAVSSSSVQQRYGLLLRLASRRPDHHIHPHISQTDH